MKTKSATYPVLIAVFLFSILFCCKKEAPKVEPAVTLTAATNITSNSSTAGGTVSADGGAPVTARGACWSSTNTTPTTAERNDPSLATYRSSRQIICGVFSD